jgi:hypothetical protein
MRFVCDLVLVVEVYTTSQPDPRFRCPNRQHVRPFLAVDPHCIKCIKPVRLAWRLSTRHHRGSCGPQQSCVATVRALLTSQAFEDHRPDCLSKFFFFVDI